MDVIAIERSIGEARQGHFATCLRGPDTAVDREILVELVAQQAGQTFAVHLGAGATQGDRLPDGVQNVCAIGLIVDDRARKLVGEVVLQREPRQVVIPRDAAGGTAAEHGVVIARHTGVDPAVAQLGVVALFKNDADRLARAVDPASMGRTGHRAQNSADRGKILHVSIPVGAGLPPRPVEKTLSSAFWPGQFVTPRKKEVTSRTATPLPCIGSDVQPVC